MGFLSDLVDDVLSIPEKVVRLPVRVVFETACAVTGGHEWGAWVAQPDGKVVRMCAECGARGQR